MKICKFNIMYINQVNIIDVQTFHALVNALFGAFTRIIPCILTVFSISAYFSRKIIFVSWYLFQGLSQYCLGLIMAIIGRNINKIYSIVYCCKNSLFSLIFINLMENSTEG